MSFYGKEVQNRKQVRTIETDQDKQAQTVEAKVKLRRKIEDYLRKYATEEQLYATARYLKII